MNTICRQRTHEKVRDCSIGSSAASSAETWNSSTLPLPLLCSIITSEFVNFIVTIYTGPASVQFSPTDISLCNARLSTPIGLKTGCCPGSAQPWREELFGACEHKLCCVRFSRLDDIVSAVEFLHFNPTCSRLATKSRQSMCVGPQRSWVRDDD